jgi:upstream activation factor subunit UAF30
MELEKAPVKTKTSLSYEKCKQVTEELDIELLQLKSIYETMKTKQKLLKKHLANLEKKMNKAQNKPQKARKPCGFAKPTEVSTVMCDFMSLPHGSLVSRTDITKKLIQYIKTNKLQNPDFKRQICPDETLYKIFGEESRKDNMITYFTMQKYMNQHFIKPSA